MKTRKLSEKRMQALIDNVNDWCRSVEDYLNSEESSLAAYYCKTLGYGKGGIDLSSLDEFCLIHVNELKRRVKDADTRAEILAECSQLKLLSIHTEPNEIFSICLGECEEQMPDDLVERIKRLNADDFEKLRRSVDCYISDRHRDLGYFNKDYDRWVLILDVDQLYRKLQDIPIPIETAEERRASFKLLQGGAA